MEPVGERRLDLLFARLEYYVLLAGGVKASELDVMDFLPGWWAKDLEEAGADETELDADQLRSKIMTMFGSLGGVDKTNGTS